MLCKSIGRCQMKGIRKKFRSVSLILVVIVIILIFPINIYNLYSANRAQQLLVEYVKSTMEGVADLYMLQLSEQIRGINRYIVYLEEHDQNLAKICDAKDWDTYYMAAFALRNEMQERMRLMGEKCGYFFYVPEMKHGMAVEASEELSQNQWMDAVVSNLNELKTRKWRIIEIEGTSWLVFQNFWKDIYIGAGIQLDPVENLIPESLPVEDVIVNITTEEALTNPDGYICVTKQCMKQDVWLLLQIANSAIVRNLPILQRYANWIVFLEFLVIPLLLYLIHKLVIRPIRKVNEAMHELKKNPDVRIQDKTYTQELSSVYQSFNQMADEIVELKIDNYESQLTKKKMELRNLQLQVKPHFLFNSLNLMFNLIQMKEYQSVQKMLLYFSDYFRYINVGEDDFSLFSDEYDLIQKYLEISEIRYPGLFEYSCEIEDSALRVQIPQLLIHNFVENVIKHGLDLTRMNHILLKSYVKENNVYFIIQDDGVGMDAEQAECINNEIFRYKDGKKHLGLRNSFRRVRFYYGDDGSIQLNSAPGKGTIVTIRIPVNRNNKNEE